MILWSYIPTYMQYCSTKPGWCKEEHQPAGEKPSCVPPRQTLSGVVTYSVFFRSEMTLDCLLLPLHCGLVPTEVTTSGTVLCHWMGWELLKMVLLTNILYWQTYGLRFIWHYTVRLYVPVFRRRKVFLTCVNVGRGLFSSAVPIAM